MYYILLCEQIEETGILDDKIFKRKDDSYEQKFVSKVFDSNDKSFHYITKLFVKHNERINHEIAGIKNKCTFEKVGNDCLLNIAAFLPVSSIGSLRIVSKKCKNCLDNSINQIINQKHKWNQNIRNKNVSIWSLECNSMELFLIKSYVEYKKLNNDIVKDFSNGDTTFLKAIKSFHEYYYDFTEWCFDNHLVPFELYALYKRYNLTTELIEDMSADHEYSDYDDDNCNSTECHCIGGCALCA